MLIPLLSLGAILLMVLLAWVMGFRGNPVLDRQAAMAEAQGRLAGFRAVDAALAAGGRGALVRGADGGLALLLPLADGWIARRLQPQMLHWHQCELQVRLDEPMLREARLAMEERPGWSS